MAGGISLKSSEGSLDLSEDQLIQAAKWLSLHQYAENRYTWLFVLDLINLYQSRSVNTRQIIDEIRFLESDESLSSTKPAEQFKFNPLKGLWHKHYFSARFLPQNIRNQMAGNRLNKVLDEVFADSEEKIFTEEIIRKLSHKVTIGAFEDRLKNKNFTGEWIIYARHNDQNYYLCLATHSMDQYKIHENIKASCSVQFPFLSI